MEEFMNKRILKKAIPSIMVWACGFAITQVGRADPVDPEILSAVQRDPAVRAKHRAFVDRLDGVAVVYNQTLQAFSRIPQQRRTIEAILVTESITSRDRKTIRSLNALVSLTNGRVERVQLVDLAPER
jgi:hypothetical protein